MFFSGGSVAIDLVCRVDCAPKIWCVIIENSFTSIPDMAHILLGSRLIKSLPLICYKNKVSHFLLAENNHNKSNRLLSLHNFLKIEQKFCSSLENSACSYVFMKIIFCQVTAYIE
jgi:hypothetical protein